MSQPVMVWNNNGKSFIYPSMVISTPSEVNFLWKGKDEVIRSSTFAPYEQGELRMIDYETMIKALRLS